MAREASWQASSAQRFGGAAAASQTVEGLLRRLIKRVEESERRYGEALDDLHDRLDQLSHTTDALPTNGSAEETETLQRLRSHLSSLAERLEKPQESNPGFDDLAKLDRILAEAREASAGLSAGPSRYAVPLTSASLPFPEAGTPFGFAFPNAAASTPASSSELPPSMPAAPDLDKGLAGLAQRIEHSLGEAQPGLIETLNKRMDDLAKRFDAALAETPKLANLQHLEQQITAIVRQVGRVEQQLARIASIESGLNRLIEAFQGTPAQLAEAASKAANEAARLVAESGQGSASAAERLDAIHRDLMAMNTRNQVTDDRIADTLTAVHESLKGLVQQAERRSRAETLRVETLRAKTLRAESHRAETTGIRNRAGFTASTRPTVPAAQEMGGHARPTDPASRNRLRSALSDLEDAKPVVTSGVAKPVPFAEPAKTHDTDQPPVPSHPFEPDLQRDSIEDLVAAARRASRATAARAEEREARRTRATHGAEEPGAAMALDLPERRKRSLLMVAAALLLLISAALLYMRLPAKPWPEFFRPAADLLKPAPAAEAPALETAPAEGAILPNATAPATPEPLPDSWSPAEVTPPPATAPLANEVPEQGVWRTTITFLDKDQVARAQALLGKLGYEIGEADGEAGMRTREAIKAFELRNGMDQTGEVTAPLIAKLEQLAG